MSHDRAKVLIDSPIRKSFVARNTCALDDGITPICSNNGLASVPGQVANSAGDKLRMNHLMFLIRAVIFRISAR